MKNLQLILKRKWYEMTQSGTKTEDYREINTYWVNRLFDWRKTECWSIHDFVRELQYHQNELNFIELYAKKFTQNTITLGYPKSIDKERILTLEHKGIEIRTGNPEWGAEPNKLYFVIMHGAILA